MTTKVREVNAIRDIPRTCVCTWTWQPRYRMWVRRPVADEIERWRREHCPWHQNRRPAQ